MKLYKVYSFDKTWWKEILISKKIYFSTPDEARQKDDLEDLSYIFPQQGMYIQLKEFYDSAMKDVRIVCLSTIFNIDVYKNLVDWSEGQIPPGIVYEFNFDQFNTGYQVKRLIILIQDMRILLNTLLQTIRLCPCLVMRIKKLTKSIFLIM